MKKLKQNTFDYVGSGIMLGTGNVVLGKLGQGGTLAPASRMYGVAGTAMMGSGVLRMVSDMVKRTNRRGKRK